MPSTEFYPVWSTASSQTKSRQGSFSDLEPGSCLAISEGSTSPLPVWDLEDSTLWDCPLPSQLVEAPLASSSAPPYDESEVPAWESSPAAWHYDDAQKLAEKLLNLDMSTENFSTRDGDRGYQSCAMNPRFKTEFCRNFREKGNCVYGDNCQFAHGKTELRQDVVRHSKYKTKLCQKFWIAGYCAYGARCNFIHQEEEDPKPYNASQPVGGFRPFRSTFYRKTSESSDSGVETGFSMPPPSLPKLQPLRPLETGMRLPSRGVEKRWNASNSAYPELNMPSDNNRYMFGNIQKINMGLEQEKSVVHHPEHNPIPTFDKSRNGL